ncbi:hypothetical protein BKA65DRAFT_821 [Rhexocercosporidium sp. MPI-PUGE-AT-0058]|nr:hypothetical protein BKA65DRAFT_821 [Rhexocercosporidium sp. MPI-PUGE-AT-0058]
MPRQINHKTLLLDPWYAQNRGACLAGLGFPIQQVVEGMVISLSSFFNQQTRPICSSIVSRRRARNRTSTYWLGRRLPCTSPVSLCGMETLSVRLPALLRYSMQTRKRYRPRPLLQKIDGGRWLTWETRRRIELIARGLGGCLAPLIILLFPTFQAHELWLIRLLCFLAYVCLFLGCGYLETCLRTAFTNPTVMSPGLDGWAKDHDDLFKYFPLIYLELILAEAWKWGHKVR